MPLSLAEGVAAYDAGAIDAFTGFAAAALALRRTARAPYVINVQTDFSVGSFVF